MTHMVHLFLILLLLGEMLWRCWKHPPRLLLHVTINTVVITILARGAGLAWNGWLPIWLWWLIAALTAFCCSIAVHNRITVHQGAVRRSSINER